MDVAVITATLPLSKPPVMNSFVVGTHNATLCRNAAAKTGRNRRARRGWLDMTITGDRLRH
jgi:hypothetical protein